MVQRSPKSRTRSFGWLPRASCRERKGKDPHALKYHRSTCLIYYSLLMVEMVASKTYIKATNSVAYLLGLACHQHRSPPNHKICMYILEIAVEVFSEADVRSSRRSSDLVKANVHHGSYCQSVTGSLPCKINKVLYKCIVLQTKVISRHYYPS